MAINGIDITYWINLDRSTDRKQNMEKIFEDEVFKEVPIIQRFSAIDGKKSGVIDRYIRVDDKTINDAEYGCLLSHLEVIREFSQSSHNIALVMEDDITLDFKKYWKKSIREVIDNAPEDWEIILLCYHSDIHPSEEYTLNQNNYWSTGAYIINNKAAKKLTSSTFIKGTYHLDDKTKQAADDYLFIKLRTYVYKYPYFIYGYSENTTIPTSNVKYHNYSRRKIEFLYDAEYVNEDTYNSSKNNSGRFSEGFNNYSSSYENDYYNKIMPFLRINLFYQFLFIFIFLIFIFFITLLFCGSEKKKNLYIPFSKF